MLLIAWCVVFAPADARAAAPSGARWAKSPAWLQDLPVDASAPVDAELSRHGTYALLRDVRIRLEPQRVERYFRNVKKAVSQAGVEALGEVQIEYAPQYEQLVLHRAALIRDGQVLDQTGKASLRLLDSEDERDQGIYSGRVSALLVLSDVRVGDVIDVAFSVNGNNPILGGRFAGHVRLGGETQVRRVHVEVSSATSRAPLRFRVRGQAEPPSDRELDGRRVLTWELKDAPPPPHEDRVPATFTRPAELELSEFANWGEVVSWAQELYPASNAASLRAKAQEFKAANPSPESAVLAALRFVQDDVRYLSISLGPNSVKPHAPDSVLAQRFGDCKDKSYLLVELLRALGVEAHPALADTDLGVHLRESLPSPYAFDHVVTAIDLGGKRYYVDPTWSHQGGALPLVAQADVGAVLVIGEGSNDVVALPDPPRSLEPPRSLNTEFAVESAGEATLRVVTTYRAGEADEMRAKFTSKSPSDVSREYLNYYAKRFPEIAVAAPIQIEDERNEDIITVRESYKISKFWRDGERVLIPDEIRSYLDAPEVPQREAPLALDHPTWIRERIQVTLPFAPEPKPSDHTFGDSAATLHEAIAYSGRQVSADYEYRSLADEVPLDRLAVHLEFLADARKNVGVDLSDETGTQPTASPSTNADDAKPHVSKRRQVAPALFLVPVALGIGVLTAVALVARSLRQRKAAEPSRDSQPAPENAASLEAARRSFTRARCACGANIPEDAVRFTKVRLGGRTVHAARADCAGCARRRHSYFSLPADAPEG